MQSQDRGEGSSRRQSSLPSSLIPLLVSGPAPRRSTTTDGYQHETASERADARDRESPHTLPSIATSTAAPLVPSLTLAPADFDDSSITPPNRHASDSSSSGDSQPEHTRRSDHSSIPSFGTHFRSNTIPTDLSTFHHHFNFSASYTYPPPAPPHVRWPQRSPWQEDEGGPSIFYPPTDGWTARDHAIPGRFQFASSPQAGPSSSQTEHLAPVRERVSPSASSRGHRHTSVPPVFFSRSLPEPRQRNHSEGDAHRAHFYRADSSFSVGSSSSTPSTSDRLPAVQAPSSNYGRSADIWNRDSVTLPPLRDIFGSPDDDLGFDFEREYRPLGSRPPTAPGTSADEDGKTQASVEGGSAQVDDTSEAGSTRALKRKRRGSESQSDADTGGQRKIPRKTDIACNFCRGRKLRCDGQRPTCRNCTQRSHPCVYAPYQKRRGPGKAPRGSRKLASRGRVRPTEPLRTGESQSQVRLPESAFGGELLDQFAAPSGMHFNQGARPNEASAVPQRDEGSPPGRTSGEGVNSRASDGGGRTGGLSTELSGMTVQDNGEETFAGMLEFIHEDYHRPDPP